MTEEETQREEESQVAVHYGDDPLCEESLDDVDDASWSEVFQTCCCHKPQEWGHIAAGLLMLLFFLYFFLVGLELLGASSKVLTGCSAGALFGDDNNPIASLMIGMLVTVLLQSSSTTTAIVVALVGADSIAINQGIYMIMGANIGTSVTNTIVAMGQMGDGDQLERAFAGATVHDMFNFLSVAVLLPVEIITGYLFYLTKAITPSEVPDGDSWEGPLKKIVGPLADLVIIENSNVIKAVAKGEDCATFYPINCTDGEESYSACQNNDGVGLISCNKHSGECPLFFQVNASRKDDEVSGGVCLFISLIVLIGCLVGLVAILQKMLLGVSARIVHKATRINGYFAILVGCGVTMIVQSSSITTSTLTPLVGIGVLQLENMLPLTLGANIGTTFTGLLAAGVSGSVASLQVALAHFLFNVTGIVIWYPLPFMRNIPLSLARRLGRATRIWRGFPLLYILVMFFLLPLLLMGISAIFEQGSLGFNVLGGFFVVVILVIILYFIWYFRCSNGVEICAQKFRQHERHRVARHGLPDDLQYLKSEIELLRKHTGLESPEEIADEEAAPTELGDSHTTKV